jgi:hypothetical protein
MTRARAAAVAIASAALFAGCGEECPTAAADVEALPASCSLAADQTVTMYVQLCPHCNETNPICDPDLSDVSGGSGTIFLDTRWETCEENEDCELPGCNVGGVACTFSVPPGTYTVATPNGMTEEIVVEAGGDPSCGNSSPALTFTPY